LNGFAEFSDSTKILSCLMPAAEWQRNLFTWSCQMPMLFTNEQNAGAEILIPVRDEEYGGRSFSCRDPEGHLWTIGTYGPWKND
jgi:uncharacterized glyoxalase superfamily protein PhnB